MAEPISEIAAADFEAVRQTARAHSLDRYLAALLAPRAIRTDLMALAAFAGEIERVPLMVSDAALGEIRLKWWTGWLEDLDVGSRTGNPVADVFGEVVRRRGLSRALIGEAIDARAQELYAAPFASEAEYEVFLIRGEGGLFQLAGEICRTDAPAGPAEVNERSSASVALGQFGSAYGGARQLLRLPLLAARGRWPLSSEGDAVDAMQLADPVVRANATRLRDNAVAATRTALVEARAMAGTMSRETIVAGLPAALVAPYLDVLARQGDWFTSAADISPLNRVWQLWRAKWTRSL